MLFDMENDWKEGTDVSVQHSEILANMSKAYEKWNTSCKNSFIGKDYEDSNFVENKTYRDNGGLMVKKKNKKGNKKNKAKNEKI